MNRKRVMFLAVCAVVFVFTTGVLAADGIQWTKEKDTAQYGGADWKNEVKRVSNVTVSEAKAIAEEDGRISYFFWIKGGTLYLGNKGVFYNGDAVFFSGEPWLGSAPGLSDTYVKADGGGYIDETDYDDGGYGEIVHLDDADFYGEAEGRLIFVDFYADWCGPCVSFGPIYEEVAAMNPETMFVKMDVDVNSSVPNDFGVQYIPYIAAVYDGEEVGKFSGSRDVDTFDRWCANYISEYGSGY